jgi:hypothetical protein
MLKNIIHVSILAAAFAAFTLLLPWCACVVSFMQSSCPEDCMNCIYSGGRYDC